MEWMLVYYRLIRDLSVVLHVWGSLGSMAEQQAVIYVAWPASDEGHQEITSTCGVLVVQAAKGLFRASNHCLGCRI